MRHPFYNDAHWPYGLNDLYLRPRSPERTRAPWPGAPQQHQGPNPNLRQPQAEPPTAPAAQQPFRVPVRRGSDRPGRFDAPFDAPLERVLRPVEEAEPPESAESARASRPPESGPRQPGEALPHSTDPADSPNRSNVSNFSAARGAAATPIAINALEAAKSRIEREATRNVEQQRRDILRDMLAVYDDVERALSAARDAAADHGPLWDGMLMMRSSFLDKLAKHGAKLVDSDGCAFDPALHEAVAVVPVDRERAGKVIQTVEHGFTIDGDLLRPARVLVGKTS